jgi:hypothetical protein
LAIWDGLVSVEETFYAFYELEKNNALPLFNNFSFKKIFRSVGLRLLQVGLPMGNAPSKASELQHAHQSLVG